MLTLGLVGLPGSGKTTACEYLKKQEFKRITLSSFILPELKKKHLTETRKNLQDMGNQLRKKHGISVLAKLAVRSIKKNKFEKIVVDGIRNLGEVKELKKLDNFYLIGIKATARTRFPRLKTNPKNKYIKTWKDFLYYEARENQSFKDKHGLQVNDCLKKSDYIINNNQTIEDLNKNIDTVLTKIKE